MNGSFDLLGQTTIDLVDLGSPTAKSFTLIKYNGSLSNFSNLVIGENALVGAGSVVTHDVPDNAIMAGNPAKLIRLITPELKVAS